MKHSYFVVFQILYNRLPLLSNCAEKNLFFNIPLNQPLFNLKNKKQNSILVYYKLK